MNEGLQRGCAPLDIPVLETERLVLRGLEPGDAPTLAAMHGDTETMRYLGGTIEPTLAEAYRRILIYTGHWALHGCGKWAVVEKASGALVGRTGYIDVPHDWPGLELGWTMAREHWGKGYGTESAIAARDWAFDVLGAQRIVSMIHKDNVASQAVARKIGETFWKTWMNDGEEALLFSLAREDWRPA